VVSVTDPYGRILGFTWLNHKKVLFYLRNINVKRAAGEIDRGGRGDNKTEYTRKLRKDNGTYL
jgi:hypothetical protein